MFPKILQIFYENRKNIPTGAVFTEKYRMFPKNRFKKVSVKRFCAKKSKKTPSIANISVHILKIEAVWRIDALPL